MKKVYLLILSCLMTTFISRAQDLTQNEIINSMLEVRDEFIPAVEEALASNGIDSKIRVFFEKTTNELVFSYQFFDKNIFDNANLDSMKKGGIQGIVSEVLKEDSTGEGLEWLVNEFKRTKTFLRYEVVYVDSNDKRHVKSGRVTPEEIQRLASLLY